MEPIQKTEEVKMPGGGTVVFRTYLTGLDKREYRRILIGLTKDGKTDSAQGLDEAENALITMGVVSVDGSEENVVSRVVGLRADDYEFVLARCSELMQGIDKKKATS